MENILIKMDNIDNGDNIDSEDNIDTKITHLLFNFFLNFDYMLLKIFKFFDI
jgi:hypothetical protein